MKLLIKNIKSLVQADDGSRQKVSGAEMKILPCLNDAWLAIEDDKIADFGKMENFSGISDWTNLQVIDATDKLVLPCWCDSHTHLVYTGSRESEFVDRVNGLTYEEIAKRGGGILNSAKKLAEATEDELFDSAMKRIHEVILQGTGAIEIKSGYGLTLEAELKMLRVIKRIKENTPIPVKATFLGAHAVPIDASTGLSMTKQKYMELLINEMLPRIAKEKLADYCDVFCEQNYFTKAETIRILTEANKYGMKGKVHAEQLSHSGGVEAGIECNALSVDHLEFVNDKDIQLLKKSDVMPTILPGAQYFLCLQYPPARKIIDAGLPLAISSDYNPGSSPSGNMNFMISHACVHYKLTPEEAINAATINAAYAMGLSKTHGSIAVGKQANIFITKEIPNYSFIPYSFANNPVETVIINGQLIVDN
ncbi:MAG: imidazolonepropionase [Bacteroidetes bacterium]|nr:MAG: imidazolonepropionase [Bacteroidota bacterium]